MENPFDLARVAAGGLNELVDRELERVVADILDLNTEAKAKRSISIKIELAPDESRNFGQVQFYVSSALGKPKPIGTTLYFGKKMGVPTAVEALPNQQSFFDQAGERPNLVQINGKNKTTEEDD